MEPHANAPMNPNLPPLPSVSPLGGGERPATAMPESAPAAFENAPQPNAGFTPLPPLPPLPVSNTTPVNATHTDDSSTTTSVTNPSTAEDNDLIEKEWVAKAKQIVASTATDPYIQSQQVSQLKADYMSKRYNKTVKLK